mgnify:CR=1 FL=1
MSSDNPSICSYQFESLSHTVPTELVDVPQSDPDRCPHPAADGEDSRCLFHASQQDFPPEAIVDEFLTGISSESRSANFAGGHFEALDLSNQVLETPEGGPIDLRGATIDGTLDLTDAEIKVPLLLGNAAITGELNADGARFHEPVDIAGTTADRGLHLYKTTFESGLAANGFETGYVDARALSVAGYAIFDEVGFSANARFARSHFGSNVSFEGAYFDLLADFTSIETESDASFSRMTVGGEARFTGASVGGSGSFDDCEFEGTTDLSHTIIDGELDATGAVFSKHADFGGFRCRGSHASFDEATFKVKATFTLVEFTNGSVSLPETTFDGEANFVQAKFGGTVTFEGATFDGLTHLRDAEFGADLILRDCDFGPQSFLHGSVIKGDCDAANASFNHFQFGATVHGGIDFRRCQFDSRAIFKRSEVGGTAHFDDASFAGNPDFSDSRFKDSTSFDNTEFLVQPTFDGTRFAREPDLEAASYPGTGSREIPERRRNMVVARPEDLRNSGLTVPGEAVTTDVILPKSAIGLTEPDTRLAQAVAQALNDIEQNDWYSLFNDAVELARTAVSKLGDESNTILAFGLSIDKSGNEAATFLYEATLTGVFELLPTESEVRFSHLNPEFNDIDYVIAVPAADDAFESGVTVGTHQEFRKAIFRRQVLQTRIFDQGDHDRVVMDYLPVLVAPTRLS